jgi:hypothetical protein
VYLLHLFFGIPRFPTVDFYCLDSLSISHSVTDVSFSGTHDLKEPN